MKLTTVTSRCWLYRVAASDPLLDALRVPRQIVVDDRLAELKVQPLRASLGAHEDLRARAEFVNQCEPYGNLTGPPSTWPGLWWTKRLRGTSRHDDQDP